MLNRRFLAAALILAATPLAAENPENKVAFDYGATITSNYVSNGVTQTNDNPALQAYLEGSFNGFYFGTWMSNVDLGPDRLEVDLYAGYRTDIVKNLFIDIGYARYLYNQTGDCCGEFKATAIWSVSPKLAVQGYFAYAPTTGRTNRRGSLIWRPVDKLAFSGSYAQRDAVTDEYWNVGATYEFNEIVSGDLRYQGASGHDAGIVASLSFSNSAFNFLRLIVNPFNR